MAKEKKKPTVGDTNFYTRLLVYPKRRFPLLLAVVVYILAFTVLLNQEMTRDTPWLYLVVPIVLAGSLLLFLPPTEQWEYKPWQNSKHKQERMFYD